MMDSLYVTTQPYGIYEHHQWSEDSKSAFVDDEHESALGDNNLDSIQAINPSSTSASRRPSMLKIEDEFSATRTPTAPSSSEMWSHRSHQMHPMRSYSTSHAPVMGGTDQPFRVIENGFNPPVQHANTWSVPHSGATTPTPLYSQVYNLPYTHPPPGFTAYQHDPASAISMSPQSSQGGWASTTSSDGIDQRGLISPTYRPTSPGTVMRPDGIRKKNARFEIPKERNLSNIDAMILASTDEGEKKELKQQKRLLRNRQAALDSRQRKKTHTEKLEAEKKVSEKRMIDIEDALARMECTLRNEREQFLQQRQHMENVIHALQYDRDEAIRAKTHETAELRRRNLVLEDCIKEMEVQQRGYGHMGHMNDYSSGYNQLGFEDSLEDGDFDLINNEDWKMEDNEHRQTTPKPLPLSSKAMDTKAEAGFSWSTVCMCLLFGAFIASNNNNSGNMENAASTIASSIPSGEASNVLKSVLSSGGADNSQVLVQPGSSGDTALNGVNTVDLTHANPNFGPSSSLDQLHQSLSTPSRRQEMAAAFSMSASTYQHINDPFNEHLNIDGSPGLNDPPTQTQSALQKAFASMQAQKDDLDKITGMGSKTRERSLLLDQVPPEVIKNFEALIQKSANNQNHNNVQTMEQ